MNNSNSKNKLFIGNLSWKATEEDLRPLFEQYGTVTKANIVYDGYTRKSRGFGFIEMGSPEEALEALEKLNDVPLMGRNLRISLAEERRDDNRGNSRSSDRGESGGYQGQGGGGGGYRGREATSGNGGGRGDRGDRGGGSRGGYNSFR